MLLQQCRGSVVSLGAGCVSAVSYTRQSFWVANTLALRLAGWRLEGSPSRHRIGGQWLFTVYAHAPSMFRVPDRSIFADVYIRDAVDKVEWAQHSVVSPGLHPSSAVRSHIEDTISPSPAQKLALSGQT